MTKQEILEGLEQMQRIQQANPPNSAQWQRASKVIHQLATLLNNGVAPKDACGKVK